MCWADCCGGRVELLLQVSGGVRIAPPGRVAGLGAVFMQASNL
jgi:hypothetical protein